MKNKIYALLTLLLLNCNSSIIKKENRIVYRSEGFTFNKKRKFSLKISEDNSTKSFDYSYKPNNEYNIRINFKKSNDTLFFHFNQK